MREEINGPLIVPPQVPLLYKTASSNICTLEKKSDILRINYNSNILYIQSKHFYYIGDI